VSDEKAVNVFDAHPVVPHRIKPRIPHVPSEDILAQGIYKQLTWWQKLFIFVMS